MAKLLASATAGAVLWVGGIAINAGLARFSNERIAAKRARTLAKLRIDFDLLLAERLSVLMASKGEAVDWSNDALQAIWASVISPVVAVQAPPLVDLVLHQLVTAPHLLPPWVSKLQLVSIDLGSRAPKLTRVALAAANENGTLPPGDVLVDFEVDLDLDVKIDILATLETAMTRLVSRLTARAHAATVNLLITRIRQGLVLRVRFRPGAAAAFVGLQRFTSPPAAEVTLTAVDVSGMHVTLPMHHFPGHDTITAWVVQKLMRDLMALPHRFIPLDLSPMLEALETREGLDLTAVPRGGSLRVQVLEAVGLTADSASRAASAELQRGGSVLDGAAQFDAGCGDGDAAPGEPGGARPSGDAARGSQRGGRGGVHAFAHVEYAFGARSARTSVAAAGADAAGRVTWAPHEGVVVVDLVGPVDAITITLRRRAVPGRAGRLAQAHFKLYWAPDGSSSVFFADASGSPVVVKAAVASARDGGRQAAGVVFSGRTGSAEVWIPLQGAAGGAGAAVRVALSAEWFGARGAASAAHRLTSEEAAAAMVMQRFVRRWKARRTAARERALLAPPRPGAQPLFTPQLQLCVTLQRARGLPLKSGYRCALAIMPGADAPPGPAAALLAAASRLPVSTATFAEASTEPRFGQSLRVDAPAGGIAALWAAAPMLRVTLFRKDAVLAMGHLAIPAAHPQQRGSAVPVWMRLGGSGLTDLARRATVRLRKGGEPAEAHEPPPGVLLFLSVVPKSAHEGPLISEEAVQQALAAMIAAKPKKPASAPEAAPAAAPAAAQVAVPAEPLAAVEEEAAAAPGELAPAAAVPETPAEAHAEAAAAAAQVDATRAAAAAAAAEAAAAAAAAEAAEREAEAALAAALAEARAEAEAELAAAAAQQQGAAPETQAAAPPEPVVDAKAAAAAKKAADAAAKAQAEADKRAAEQARKTAEAEAKAKAAAEKAAAEQARKAAEAEAKAKAAADKAAAEEARKAAEAEKKAAEAAAKQHAAEEKAAAEQARKAAEAEAKANAAADKAGAEEAKKAAEQAAAAAAAEKAAADKAAAEQAAAEKAAAEQAAAEAAAEKAAADKAAADAEAEQAAAKAAADEARVRALEAAEAAASKPQPVPTEKEAEAAPAATTEAAPEPQAAPEEAAPVAAPEHEAAAKEAPASEAAPEPQTEPQAVPEPEAAPAPVPLPDAKAAAAAKKAADAAAKAQAEADKRAAEQARKAAAAEAKAKAAADKAAAEEARKAAAAEKKAAEAAAKQRVADEKRAAEEARKAAEAEAKAKAAAEAEQYRLRKAQAHAAAALHSPPPRPAASPPPAHTEGHYEDSDGEGDDATAPVAPPAGLRVATKTAAQEAPPAPPAAPAHVAGHYDSDAGSTPNTGDYLHTIHEEPVPLSPEPVPATPPPAARAFGSPVESAAAASPTPVPSPGSATPGTPPPAVPAKPAAPMPWPAPPPRSQRGSDE